VGLEPAILKLQIQANSSVLISYLVHRRSEKYVIKGSKYAHWIGLYLSFHLDWVLGPFVHGRLQNLQTSEVTFAHVNPFNSGEFRFMLTKYL